MTRAGRSEAVLAVRDLTVYLTLEGRSHPVVDAVSFELAPGEIVGLAGESGCGKSLTASALLGMVPEPAGRMQVRELRLAGQNVSDLDRRGWQRMRGREIAMIFQDPLSALDPVLTIGRQLTEVIRRHRGGTRGDARREARNLLAEVRLPEPGAMLLRYPHQLSGGMRQRVLVAMALSCQPRVVIADEPTTALDVTTQAQILDLLEERARAHAIAVLLVTHDLAVVRRVCDRVLIMYGGRIVEEGPAAAVLTDPAHPYTAGLLSAMPQLAAGRPAVVQPIAGQVPSPGGLPAGCSFNDRCARADAKCRAENPRLSAARPAADHRYACHHPLEPGVR